MCCDGGERGGLTDRQTDVADSNGREKLVTRVFVTFFSVVKPAKSFPQKAYCHDNRE